MLRWLSKSWPSRTPIYQNPHLPLGPPVSRRQPSASEIENASSPVCVVCAFCGQFHATDLMVPATSARGYARLSGRFGPELTYLPCPGPNPPSSDAPSPTTARGTPMPLVKPESRLSAQEFSSLLLLYVPKTRICQLITPCFPGDCAPSALSRDPSAPGFGLRIPQSKIQNPKWEGCNTVGYIDGGTRRAPGRPQSPGRVGLSEC